MTPLNEKCTIVTALYDLGREHWKPPYHRAWVYYLKNFRKTLSIRCKMVIFVEAKDVPLVERIRAKYDPNLARTRIYARRLEELPAFVYHDRIQQILNAESFQSRLASRLNPSSYVPLYHVVLHSKTGLVYEVSEGNPLDTRYFMWMDAGLGREKFPNQLRGAYYPDDDRLADLDDDRLRIVCRRMPQPSDLDIEKFFGAGINRFAGGWWVGTAAAVTAFDRSCTRVLEDALALGVCDWDQSVYAVTYLRNPERFTLCHGDWYAGLIGWQAPAGRVRPEVSAR